MQTKILTAKQNHEVQDDFPQNMSRFTIHDVRSRNMSCVWLITFSPLHLFVIIYRGKELKTLLFVLHTHEKSKTDSSKNVKSTARFTSFTERLRAHTALPAVCAAAVRCCLCLLYVSLSMCCVAC